MGERLETQESDRAMCCQFLAWTYDLTRLLSKIEFVVTSQAHVPVDPRAV